MTSTTGVVTMPFMSSSAPVRRELGLSSALADRHHHAVWRAALRRWYLAQGRVEQICYVIGAVLIASGGLHLVIAGLDDRPWSGPLSWRKPATFGVSFGLTLVAITWLSSYLRLSTAARAWLLGIFAADCVVEVLGITVQAWRHLPSHFNTRTPIDASIAYGLAAGGAVLIVVLGVLAVTALRGRIDASPSMRIALRVGFTLLMAGLFSGVAMIVRGTSLIRAGDESGYSAAGYLKWFHGITLHAVVVLAALAWLLDRSDQSETRRKWVLTAASAVYVTMAILTLTWSVQHA
jgi:hypothetical protein